jgi:hypothetical protein
MSKTMDPLLAVRPAAEQSRFPWPSDPQAWWNIAVSLGVGWFLILGLRFDSRALALAVAGLSLFFASEWFSQLAGRSREGDVRPAHLAEPFGIGFLVLTVVSLGVFLWQTSPLQREAWATVITAVACMVALLFILRLEWRPLDARLLVVTHLIITLPCLMFGFVVWGAGSPLAWNAWYLPAAYFPAQALFAQYWMEGTDQPASSLSVLALPVLAGVLLLAGGGAWWGAAFLGLFLTRVILGLHRRRLAQRLPGFAEMKRLSKELQAWNLVAIAAWALCLR